MNSIYQIRRFKYEIYSKKMIGQIVNVPVDVNNMVNELPRNLSDDYTFNIHIKKILLHKSTYLEGSVNKSLIKE